MHKQWAAWRKHKWATTLSSKVLIKNLVLQYVLFILNTFITICFNIIMLGEISTVSMIFWSINSNMSYLCIAVFVLALCSLISVYIQPIWRLRWYYLSIPFSNYNLVCNQGQILFNTYIMPDYIIFLLLSKRNTVKYLLIFS